MVKLVVSNRYINSDFTGICYISVIITNTMQTNSRFSKYLLKRDNQGDLQNQHYYHYCLNGIGTNAKNTFIFNIPIEFSINFYT